MRLFDYLLSKIQLLCFVVCMLVGIHRAVLGVAYFYAFGLGYTDIMVFNYIMVFGGI